MLKIKDFNTAYWGFIRTASEPYPCHEKVNAFIGPSGSGKTTLMDAIRIALGDAKFENNRAMDHYIYKNSNWAVVRVAFWNRTEEGKPFTFVGYHADEVTVCVRLDRSTGQCKREYYMFDGPFYNIVELGLSSKLYRECQINYTEYLKHLEVVGLTPAFRRLMMMRPEDVQNVVNLSPHQLFQLIFELKGQKRIQDEHQQAQEKMHKLRNEEELTSKDLQQAQEKLKDYEVKKRLFEENEERKQEYTMLYHLMLKRRWWNSQNDLSSQKNELAKVQIERDEALNEKKKLESNLQELSQTLDLANQQNEEVRKELDQILNDRDEKSGDYSEKNQKLKEKCEEIAQTEQIVEEDITLLNGALRNAKQDDIEIEINRRNLQAQKKQFGTLLIELESGKGGVPSWVKRYHSALEHNQIPVTMLADCVIVRPEYEHWLEAIEALLGRERFRMVVPKEYQLQAKKLQEQFEYRARVSLPRRPRRQINTELLKNKYVSVLNALEIENMDIVGGYLEYLNEIYLVDTVEEGHKIQQEGFTSLTRNGLLQDNDGALFLKTRELVCGRLARERYRQQITTKLGNIEEQIVNIDKKYNALSEQIEKLKQRIDLQNHRQNLPQLYKEHSELDKLVAKSLAELEEVKASHESMIINQKQIGNQIVELTGEIERKKEKLIAFYNQVQLLDRTINGYRGNIGKCKHAVENAEKELFAIGYDEEMLVFLNAEITQKRIFERSDGTEWTHELLQSRVKDLDDEMERFQYKYSDINQGVIAMVEPQKSRVHHLEEALVKAKSEREEWEERLASAELALRNHVREIMEQYIEEFTVMTALLGAKAQGKFEQEGQNYTQWSLRLKLAFDGKELKPYYDPEFSSGQRAANSIMLLLAAMNNQREGTQNCLMFLDEPTARVDDVRANEIGMVLQRTQVQYFITHQVSASLHSVDWIDHGYVTSKLRDGDQFADDPIFESRRVLS